MHNEYFFCKTVTENQFLKIFWREEGVDSRININYRVSVLIIRIRCLPFKAKSIKDMYAEKQVKEL